jgi:hypothetical protein
MSKAQSMTHILFTTLPQMFRERIINTPQTVAYRYFDKDNKLWRIEGGFTFRENEQTLNFYTFDEQKTRL